MYHRIRLTSHQHSKYDESTALKAEHDHIPFLFVQGQSSEKKPYCFFQNVDNVSAHQQWWGSPGSLLIFSCFWHFNLHVGLLDDISKMLRPHDMFIVAGDFSVQRIVCSFDREVGYSLPSHYSGSYDEFFERTFNLGLIKLNTILNSQNNLLNLVFISNNLAIARPFMPLNAVLRRIRLEFGQIKCGLMH